MTPLAAGLALAGHSVDAHAQTSGSNEAFVGQVGDDNRLQILQQGANNRIGDGELNTLRLTFGPTSFFVNQLGSNNDANIRQTGFGNLAGTTIFGDDPNLSPAVSAGIVPSGVNQNGDGNLLTIDQYAVGPGRTAGIGNVVGSLRQESPSGAATGVNAITIRQGVAEPQLPAAILESGSLEPDGGHRVGVIDQRGSGGSPNVITVSQTGGGPMRGNSVGQIFQTGITGEGGDGNRIAVTQSGGFANVVSVLAQEGDRNTFVIEQSGGDQNSLNTARQRGSGNLAEILLSRVGNGIDEILQDNSAGSDGNFISATIIGLGNGFEASGQQGVSTFTGRLERLAAQTRATSVSLGSILQIGGGHSVNLLIEGDGNVFGFSQTGGDGNNLDAQQFGNDNQVGAVQIGTRNDLAIWQAGIGNAAGVTMEGDGNLLDVLQTGDGNGVSVFIEGSGNNGRAFAAAMLDGVPPLVPRGLSPGRLVQEGIGNAISLDVTGNDNALAIWQIGAANVAIGNVVGSGNQSVVVQIGNGNTADYAQIGDGNRARILQ